MKHTLASSLERGVGTLASPLERGHGGNARLWRAVSPEN
jgi:hypothetical protein